MYIRCKLGLHDWKPQPYEDPWKGRFIEKCTDCGAMQAFIMPKGD